MFFTNPSATRKPRVFALAGTVIGLIASAGLAQTWDGGGAVNNRTNALNWVGDVARANNGTANIVMAGTVDPTPNVNVAQDILSLVFNPTSGLFTIGSTTLTVRGGGITNNDADQQTLSCPLVVAAGQTWQAASGAMTFTGSSITLTSTLTVDADAGFAVQYLPDRVRLRAPPCEPCDTNCDTVVNGLDVDRFVRRLIDASAFCSTCAADANGDAMIDVTDIPGFVVCLLAP